MKKLVILCSLMLFGCSESVAIEENSELNSNIEHNFKTTMNVETKVILIKEHEYILATKIDAVSIIHSASCQNEIHSHHE